MAVYFGRNKTYRQPPSFPLAYSTHSTPKTPTSSSQKLYNKFHQELVKQTTNRKDTKMEVVNYSELGAEERIVAWNSLRNRTEFLNMSLDSARQDAELDINETFCLPEGSTSVRPMFDGYDADGNPTVIANVTFDSSNVAQWLGVTLRKDNEAVPTEIELKLVQRLKMRYIDGVVGVAVTGYAGLSESTIERMETELTHIMNRIGEHAQRVAQGAINHYFSDEEVSRWLAHNDLECYSDGMIAEEEV